MNDRWAVVSMVVVVALVGCARQGAQGTARGTALGPAQQQAILVAADRRDGAEDHVIAKCPVCGLAMEGSPEYASKFAGYEVHFCSSECKETFEKNPEKIIARLAEAAP